MSRTLKKYVYRGAKWLGLFRLARRMTGKQLRILGYHGFATGDEVQFRPQLFMDASEFRWRIDHILRHAYPVLALDDALDRLRQNELPACAVVLTFDDGAYSTWKLAFPTMQSHRLPGTIYLTTYYCVHPNPVFRIAVQYMFWKTSKEELSLAGLGLNGDGVLSLSDADSKNRAMWMVIDHAEGRFHEAERVALCAELGRRLDVDYAEIARARPFSLMTAGEVRQAADTGADIQMHTHRHVLPEEPDQARSEVEENRRVIASLTGRQPRHFCYPSGICSEARRQVLVAAGVASATTCESGLNYSDTPPLALRRFMDGSDISRIEFEAELSGFSEILRRLVRGTPSRDRPLRKSAGAAVPSRPVGVCGGRIPNFLGRGEGRAAEILQWSDVFVADVVRELPAVRAGTPAREDLVPELQVNGLVDASGRLTPLGAKLAYHLAEFHRQATFSQDGDFLAELRLGEGSQILDIGCGAGQTLFRLQSFGPGECIGIDHDMEALAWGDRVRSVLADNNVTFLCASGERIPLPANRVTHVFSRVAINYMHQHRALREAVRVLRPGGMLYCQVENIGHDLKLLFGARGVRSRVGKLYELTAGSAAAVTGLQLTPDSRLASKRIFAPVHRLRRLLRGLGCDEVRWKTNASYLGFPAGTTLIARKRPL